jgi:hypothetical protein
MEKNKVQGFVYEKRHVGAFDIIGFSKMVNSGGELYDEIWSDGRWAILKEMNSKNKTVYGIASEATCPVTCSRSTDECPRGCYRYTMGILNNKNYFENSEYNELFKFHVGESEWIIFTLEANNGHGELWGKDPYKMITELGYNFNTALNIHIDVFYENYNGENDGKTSEFWMPVI